LIIIFYFKDHANNLLHDVLLITKDEKYIIIVIANQVYLIET